MFALRNKVTNKIVKFTYNSNGDQDDCVPVTFSLSLFGEHIFIKPTREAMEEYLLRAKETSWYNADLDTPNLEHAFNLDDCEIVELFVK
ncbi:hypothetical protein NCTGTJJY_CDS0289 [Serratia phage 92A1]|nr:hypothetical protein NCTGTJJY_CDS0289 [Serratia phage 92A1]